jgi:hypothetical protein
MAFEDAVIVEAAAAEPPPFWCFSPLPMAFKVMADDLRHKIMIKIAATVRTTPPITADKMVMRDRLSEKLWRF